MDRLIPCLGLESLTPPGREITRIWRALRPIDCAFIRLIIGDLSMLAESPIDWTFLRTAIEFWDPPRAVFNFQGTKLTLTVEEYMALIQRSIPRRDIMVPNQFPVIQSQLSILLACKTFPPRRTALRIGSCGQTCHLQLQTDSCEFKRFDGCGIHASHRISTSQSTLLTRSELSPPLQHMWLSSTYRTRYSSNSLGQPRFHESPLQLLRKPRVPPRQPCVRSCSLSGRSKINSAVSLTTLVQSLQITESYRGS
ncbi:hypothetical protein CRG98_003783 [Punica granatum]|uniref:Aminotransferase-like plant mobile domain-containing protein n=1 Tax=Punica granatum TaxID=22663 RepID=A0A2I0L5A0_PUNGR|nr:hypothetical protein CRG98_003783 [Punica granatum]